jgi:hypothetical protein
LTILTLTAAAEQKHASATYIDNLRAKSENFKLNLLRINHDTLSAYRRALDVDRIQLYTHLTQCGRTNCALLAQ